MFTVTGQKHSVANTVFFTIHAGEHGIDVGMALLAVLVAFLGNLVGGGLLIGVIHAYLDNAPRRHARPQIS